MILSDLSIFLNTKYIYIWTRHVRSSRKCVCPFWLPLRTSLILYNIIIDPQLAWTAVSSKLQIVWSSHIIAEYGSTGLGCQSCSWSAEQGKRIFPCACPRACLRIWSRETGSAVSFRVILLIISILRLNLVLTYGIPPEFRGGVHLWNRHTPSGQSRVYRVTQLRTDGVHCRESAGTIGPVNLKVVPNECCVRRSLWTN